MLDLYLNGLEMTADCCGPVLQRLLSLGSRGPQHLYLSFNPALSPLVRPLVRIISDENYYVQSFHIDGLYGLEWEDGVEGLEGRCQDTLWLALKRNERFQKETHEAALGTLKVARTVLLGSSTPVPSSCVPSEPNFPLLDLPPELLQVVLSFVYPGALSDRQFLAVIQHAADRTTLVPTRLRRPMWQGRLEFLQENGCNCYDR